MFARCRYFFVPLAALLLAAVTVQAQNPAPAEQPLLGPSGDSSNNVIPAPSDSTFGDQPSAGLDGCEAAPCGPTIFFQGDWLWTLRKGEPSGGRDIVGGENATGFGDVPEVAGASGYRFDGGIRLGDWIIEGVYSNMGGWNSSLVKSIDGVAFNDTAVAGDWSGRNFIDASTYFAPIFNAATMGAPVNTLNDQSGLGPSTSFAADARPELALGYHSSFDMFEMNVKCADCFFTEFGGGMRLGAGFASADLDEISQVGLFGTFRAVSNVAAATVGIPNSALTSTATNGGNLQLMSGGGTGFNDGTVDGSGIPSQLAFTYQATTKNRLDGAQLVLDGDLLQFHRFLIGGSLKAGVFDNFATGTIVETYGETNKDLSVYDREFQNSRNQISFLGGASMNVGYRVTDHATVRFGYEALFLTGLALSPDQVNGINYNFYKVQADGTTLIHGANLGLDFAY